MPDYTLSIENPEIVRSIEPKGVLLPPVEEEVRRTNWKIQRFLLLAGLVWISLGVGVFVFFSAVLAIPSRSRFLRAFSGWASHQRSLGYRI